jgi:DNA-binding transcriptional ArsR family regulator
MCAALTEDRTESQDTSSCTENGSPAAVTLPPEEAIQNLVALCKLLADETRLRILFLLRRAGEMNVLELCKRLDQRQPSVSHHLALLREANLIAMRRAGKHNFYRVRRDQLEAALSTIFHANPWREYV